MRKVLVELPDELLDLVGGQEQASHLMTQAAVAELVRRRAISSGRASELLGVDRWDLADLLNTFEVSVVGFSSNDLKSFR